MKEIYMPNITINGIYSIGGINLNRLIAPKKELSRLALIFFIVLIIPAGCAVAPYTPDITDGSPRQVPGSIASLEKVTLGGVEQWITIRGRSLANPILLFLHGGPGSA